MGCKFKFLTSNYIDSNVLPNLIYSSQNAAYPAINIQEAFRSLVWRSNAGYFEVTSSNNTFVINDGTNKTITLTIATYTSGATLAADVQTKLNAASSNFTVLYSTTYNKFTISRTSSFSIIWTDPTTSAYALLGYNSLVDDTGLTSYEADENRICYPAEYLKFDLGISRNPKAVILIDNLEENIKIQPSINVRLQGNHGDSWNNPEEVSLSYNSDNMTSINMDGLFTVPYRYYRLYIPDTTNPLGYVQLGKVYIGEVFELASTNINREFSEAYFDLTNIQRAVSGEIYTDESNSHRQFSDLTIQYCSKVDVDLVKDIYNDHRTYRPFFVSIDSTATVTNDVNEWTRYVRFSRPPEYSVYSKDLWTIKFGLEELL